MRKTSIQIILFFSLCLFLNSCGGGLSKEQVNKLVKKLGYKDLKVRSDSAQKLGEGGKSAVPALLKALDSDDPNVKHWAVYSLGNIGPAAAPAVPKIMKLLDSKNFATKKNAVVTLGMIGPKAAVAVPKLEKLLYDEKLGWNITFVAGSLASIGNAGLNVLKKATKSDNSDLKDIAQEALEGFKE